MKKREVKIKTKALVLLGVFLLSIVSVAAVAGQMLQPPRPIPIPEPIEPPVDGDYTKLQISPRHEWFEIKPGGEEEFTVTVKNKEEESVSTQVQIEIPPYGEYCFEKEWITVEPDSAEIKAGEEQEYTVKVQIPEDAEIGYYSVQVVFTNDTIPTPYPEPFPMYVNSLDLSINVWEQPKIQIQPQWIHGRIEAGQSQQYKIQLENTGDEAIAINPEIGGGERWPGPSENSIPDAWLAIEAPAKVDANSKATVMVTVDVPVDAKGRYHGSINLNIAEPAMERWDQEVHMDIEVWKQPSAPFRKDFSVKQGEKICVEVTASQHAYDNYGGETEEEEPSFNVALIPAAGETQTPEPSKTIKMGDVSMGMDYLPPWETSSEGMYHVMSTEYCETYEITNATGGIWTLEILPKNAESFEYSIAIEE